MNGASLLLHTCCAPCLSAPWLSLKSEGWRLETFFFNPNIHPFTEYVKRRDCLIDFAREQNIPLRLRDDYALEKFLREVANNEDSRCRFCYQWRLSETAKHAKLHGFSHFSTTLLVSPYQKHELIREAGELAAKTNGVEFHYSDLRALWRERGRLTKKHQLYRQQYCGCIYSEKERYADKQEAGVLGG